MPILRTRRKVPHGQTRASRAGRPGWPWALGALPLLGLALVAGLALSGAAAPRELIDPGPLVRWGLPVTTSLTRVAATVTIGALMLCAVVLPRMTAATMPSSSGSSGQTRREADPAAVLESGRDRPAELTGGVAENPTWRRVANIGVAAAAVWAPAQLAHLVLTHAAALGTAIGGPGYGAELIQFATQIDMGRYLSGATFLAAIVALLTAAVAGYASAAWTAIVALVALLPISVTGHAAGAANHDFAVTSWWLHVAAITAWVGGLGVLCVVASRVGPGLAEIAQRFSRIAIWAFVIATVAGVANAAIRFATPLDLFLHPYGQLLLIKAVLTMVLGLAGWAHRAMTIPAIRSGTRSAGRGAGWAFWRLAGVELLIMAAVIGVAVALGSSAPPAPQEPPTEVSSVYLLTGYWQPPLPTALTYLTQWRPDPMTTLVTIAALVVYLSWVWRLRRRGQTWPTARVVSWAAGMLVFFWSTNGGPGVYGSVLFSSHMAHHMVLVVVVPMLLVLGAPANLAIRALPGRSDGSRGPREWITALKSSRLMLFLTHPTVATVNVAASLVIFYYSPLFRLAQDSRTVHVLCIMYFTAAGYLLARALLVAHHRRRQAPLVRRLAPAIAAMSFYAVLGMVLVSSTSLLAADHYGRLGLSWGVDALADQRTGGLVVWGIGQVAMVAVAVALIISWTRTPVAPRPPSGRALERRTVSG